MRMIALVNILIGISEELERIANALEARNKAEVLRLEREWDDISEEFPTEKGSKRQRSIMRVIKALDADYDKEEQT